MNGCERLCVRTCPQLFFIVIGLIVHVSDTGETSARSIKQIVWRLFSGILHNVFSGIFFEPSSSRYSAMHRTAAGPLELDTLPTPEVTKPYYVRLHGMVAVSLAPIRN